MPAEGTLAAQLKRSRRILSRIEFRLIVVWIAAVGAVWSFFGLASEWREGELVGFDNWILNALRQPGHPHEPVGPAWLAEMMRDLSGAGSVTMLTLVTLAAFIVLMAYERRREAMTFAAGVLMATISSDIFKAFYSRPRPAYAIYSILPTSHSFPSGHSTSSTATYFLLAIVIARLEARFSVKVLAFGFAALLSILIGISRVYLGVHWPSDVLAGWCLGAGWALIVGQFVAQTKRQ